MNIIKYYFIYLLLFIIKNNGSPWNHLDLQLSLLILSAGNHDGEIIKDKATDNYLKINVKDNSKIEMVDIVEIIPKLRKMRNNKEVASNIENEFKKLYKKAEMIAYNRLGYTYNNGKSLFDYYKGSNNNNNDNNNNEDKKISR